MRREHAWQRAAVMFADRMGALDIEAVLEVSTKSAYAWLADGAAGLASRGSSSMTGSWRCVAA